MKDRLKKFMMDLEEIIRQIEDSKNVLNMNCMATNQEMKEEWLKSVLNVQIRLLEIIETDSRRLHQEIDETILDMAHNRI